MGKDSKIELRDRCHGTGLAASEDTPGGACCITPAGLRTLADLLLRGKLLDAIDLAAKRREAGNA